MSLKSMDVYLEELRSAASYDGYHISNEEVANMDFRQVPQQAALMPQYVPQHELQQVPKPFQLQTPHHQVPNVVVERRNKMKHSLDEQSDYTLQFSNQSRLEETYKSGRVFVKDHNIGDSNPQQAVLRQWPQYVPQHELQQVPQPFQLQAPNQVPNVVVERRNKIKHSLEEQRDYALMFSNQSRLKETYKSGRVFAKEYNIGESNLRRWVGNLKSGKYDNLDSSSNRYRQNEIRFPVIEQRLVKYLEDNKQIPSGQITLSWTHFQQKALQFARQYLENEESKVLSETERKKLLKFKASSGWLQNVLERHGISMQGDAAHDMNLLGDTTPF